MVGMKVHHIKHNLMMLLSFKGKSLKADIVLKCTGLTPNTSLTDKIFGKNVFSNLHCYVMNLAKI